MDPPVVGVREGVLGASVDVAPNGGVGVRDGVRVGPRVLVGADCARAVPGEPVALQMQRRSATKEATGARRRTDSIFHF